MFEEISSVNKSKIAAVWVEFQAEVSGRESKKLATVVHGKSMHVSKKRVDMIYSVQCNAVQRQGKMRLRVRSLKKIRENNSAFFS